MKNRTLLFISCLLVVAATSCRRDYNCTCTSDYTAEGADDMQHSSTIKNVTKKVAKKKCDLGDKADSGTNVTIDCEINP